MNIVNNTGNTWLSQQAKRGDSKCPVCVCIVLLLTQLFKYISFYYLQYTEWFLIIFLGGGQPSDGVGPNPPALHPIHFIIEW